MKKLLHVGCGPQNKISLKGFNNPLWKEIRLDIDEDVKPDIVGTLTNMNSVDSGSVDALYSAHNIEHIFPHEVPKALLEFNRVLKDDGFVVITCPDLISVCQAVVNEKLMEQVYTSPAGPISPIDILYGHRETTINSNIFMAHKSGFTYSLLDRVFSEAGFEARVGGRRPEGFDLYLVAFKQKKSDEELTKIATPFLPSPRTK